MRDLISREDAIKVVHEHFIESLYEEPTKIDEDGDEVFADMRSVNKLLTHNKVISKALKALPSADDVQGELKYTITGQPYCSNCEYVFGEDEEFSPFWDYCPMCGARMTKGGGAE